MPAVLVVGGGQGDVHGGRSRTKATAARSRCDLDNARVAGNPAPKPALTVTVDHERGAPSGRQMRGLSAQTQRFSCVGHQRRWRQPTVTQIKPQRLMKDRG
jgi:hypothetical protein